MTTRDITLPFTASDERWAPTLANAGSAVLRYGLAALLLLWGSYKFAEFEAEAIRPLVENSPLVSWMYAAFGVRGTSALFGVVEVGAAYFFYLCKNRPFTDGNKRVALATCLVFLRANGVGTAPDSPGWEQLVLGVAASRLDRDGTTSRLRTLVGGR